MLIAQYMHIPEPEKCNWIREKIETIDAPQYSQSEKLQILDRVAWSEMFESFLANKYSSAKRCEATHALVQRNNPLALESLSIACC